MRSLRIVACLVVIAASAAIANAGGGTALTYQGRLLDAGEPADGMFNVDFSLWDAPSAGSQVGSTIVFNSLPISDGLFTVELDFGANAFDNSDRWVEINVNGFTLEPRQKITRSPYSIQTRGIFVNDAGDVGIGTTDPQRKLDISAVEPVVRLTSNTESPTGSASLQFKRAIDSQSIFKPLGKIEFVNLNDETEVQITALRLGRSSSLLTFNVGVDNVFPQLLLTPENGAEFGQHLIKPALAYGAIDGVNGIIISSSSNVISLTHVNAGVYWIDVEGGILETDVMMVTMRTIGYVTAREVNDIMIVRCFNAANPLSNIDRDFSFVIYRP